MTALPRRAVLVVDEAGMVSTRELAELVDHADRADAKLVLVGDHRQLAEIEAGGAFRALATRLPVIELKENRRQSAAWERDALALLRDGDAAEALRRYERHGRVTTGESADEVRGRLVADWWASASRDEAVMIAFRRVDVADLNGRARALMRAAARSATPSSCSTAAVRRRRPRAAAPQRPAARRRQRRSRHRRRGRPAARRVDVELAGGRVRLDAGYLGQRTRGEDPALVHGYAITGPQRARADVPRDVRARDERSVARVGLHRAQPRPRREPALRRRTGSRRARGVRTGHRARGDGARSDLRRREAHQRADAGVGGRRRPLASGGRARSCRASARRRNAARGSPSSSSGGLSVLRPRARARHDAALGTARQNERDAAADPR